jgi:hypothetical protein
MSDAVDRPHDVVLMTSELVANVVRHARTDVMVAVDLGPPTRVEVRDGATATDAFRDMVAPRRRCYRRRGAEGSVLCMTWPPESGSMTTLRVGRSSGSSAERRGRAAASPRLPPPDCVVAGRCGDAVDQDGDGNT